MPILRNLGILLLPAIVKVLFSTLRATFTNPELQPDHHAGKIIYAFWHGKMMYGWLLAKKIFPDKNIHAVVSQSKDGELLSHVLAKLGFSLIRGSSSKGSSEVKKSMIARLEKNGIIAITPDGPRGPSQTLKYGTLRLASERDVPIVFAAIRFTKALRLRSWDGFEIPLPFSALSVTYHLIKVPVLHSKEDLAVFERQLSKQLADA
ncbi:MAG: lysophospholipid acyltransferase family protein [Chlorobium phaeobacteroides]|uniref:DUF374 domain-containing protein n=1 Tax=Chlorobium phaeobacteroides (strain BS1) TaxID=331678 RepID=B3EMB6_CHLPB|nr:lysophospholipid acyltransferase family protein [Chlorobium phaeobacteroides]MBL6955777.1 lysophospholipid acyltransferase family protein [Chlorobium phaeobacteroides]